MASGSRQKLGPGYVWVEHQQGRVLELHGVPLASLQPVSTAWLVTVLITGAGIEAQRVVVPSLDRGVGWLVTWARHRNLALERMVDEILRRPPG